MKRVLFFLLMLPSALVMRTFVMPDMLIIEECVFCWSYWRAAGGRKTKN